MKISIEYLNNEKARGYDVEAWMIAYCKRNKIPLSKNDIDYHLTFRSQKQMDWFLIKGNRCFPYFEFL